MYTFGKTLVSSVDFLIDTECFFLYYTIFNEKKKNNQCRMFEFVKKKTHIKGNLYVFP